jgi:uncharacterized protein
MLSYKGLVLKGNNMNSKNISKTIDEIANKFNIDFIVYFGSYQTEFYNKESDIDIAFLAAAPMDLDTYSHFLEALIFYHRKSEIDLIDLKKAEPVLRFEIAKSGRVLYEREKDLFNTYSFFYIKRFYELKPVIEEEMRTISENIRMVISND